MMSATVLQEHWAFFYKENGPNGKPLDGISYFCLTKSTSGIVPLEQAVKVARRYENQGVNIVLDMDAKGNPLPLSPKERTILVAADTKIERETLVRRVYPGRAYLRDLLAKIPPQIPSFQRD